MAVKKEIPEAKIRQVIWMLKAGKTKKACCEHLGIAYNTKRLDSIVEEFKADLAAEEQRKKEARGKPIDDSTKAYIVTTYQEGVAVSVIAEKLYLTPQKVKQVLIEKNVPIRGRSKKAGANVDHVVQDLDKKFAVGERVFIPKTNEFGIVKKVYDEDYIEQFFSARLKSVELHPWKDLKPDQEPVEGVHFESYYELENGEEWKRGAVQYMISRINRVIEDTGRESYLIWHTGDSQYFGEYYRRDLFPVIGVTSA